MYDEDLLRCIISYNYELSVEKAIEGFDDKFYYPLIDKNSRKERIPFFKLHGSLNWKEDQSRITRDDNTVVSMEYRSSDDYIQPSIIAPTLFKQEINIDFQRDYRARFYKNLWHECWRHLQETDSIIIAGFSFPATDWHAQVLFESAGRKRGGFKKIIYCHKDDSKNDDSKKVRSIFGDADLIEESEGLESLSKNIDKFLEFMKKA
ncbi:MAG: SIR2 family protein [Nitrospirae bacterium]|nr:SIR2 family protein [Nitrospirota bacterium]